MPPNPIPIRIVRQLDTRFGLVMNPHGCAGIVLCFLRDRTPPFRLDPAAYVPLMGAILGTCTALESGISSQFRIVPSNDPGAPALQFTTRPKDPYAQILLLPPVPTLDELAKDEPISIIGPTLHRLDGEALDLVGLTLWACISDSKKVMAEHG
jgi:hypothetical protein